MIVLARKDHLGSNFEVEIKDILVMLARKLII